MPDRTLQQKCLGLPFFVRVLVMIALLVAPLTLFLTRDRSNHHTASIPASNEDRTTLLQLASVTHRCAEKSEDHAHIAMQMWEQYLNGPGVTIKMFECGQWGVSANFGECVDAMIHSLYASVMHFDLPAVTFVQGLPIGFAYKPSKSLQWCASPGDTAYSGSRCEKFANMTKEEYFEDYKLKRKQCPSPAYSPILSVSWPEAFSYRHYLQRSIAETWTEEDERIYKQNQLCMFYNEVHLNKPRIQDIQAIVVRNLSKDDGGPSQSLELAYKLKDLIRDRYNIDFPVVQYALIEEECYNPRATVARWDAGKEHAKNSIFFPAPNMPLHKRGYVADEVLSPPVWTQKASADAIAAYQKCTTTTTTTTTKM